MKSRYRRKPHNICKLSRDALGPIRTSDWAVKRDQKLQHSEACWLHDCNTQDVARIIDTSIIYEIFEMRIQLYRNIFSWFYNKSTWHSNEAITHRRHEWMINIEICEKYTRTSVKSAEGLASARLGGAGRSSLIAQR